MLTNTNFVLKGGKEPEKVCWLLCVTNPQQKSQNMKHIPPSQINCNELLNPRRGKQEPLKRNIQHRFKKCSKISLCSGFHMKPIEHLYASTSTLKGSFRDNFQNEMDSKRQAASKP